MIGSISRLNSEFGEDDDSVIASALSESRALKNTYI